MLFCCIIRQTLSVKPLSRVLKNPSKRRALMSKFGVKNKDSKKNIEKKMKQQLAALAKKNAKKKK